MLRAAAYLLAATAMASAASAKPAGPAPDLARAIAADDLATNAYGERALIHDHTLCAERKRGADREQ